MHRRRSGGWLFATTSAVALIAGGAGAEAQVIANPATPFTNSATIKAITFDDGLVHNGNVTNATTGVINASGAPFPGFTGITVINNSTLSGVITNSGSITAANNGIAVEGAVVAGDIVNATTGKIVASGFGNGISLINASLNAGAFSGSILNNGSISTEASGIIINFSTVTGEILNLGPITSTSNGSSDAGINVFNGTVKGNIVNASSITIGGNNDGIEVTDGVVGSVSNSGTITASGGTGIRVFGFTTLNGDVSNSGTIHSGAIGIDVASGTLVAVSASATGSVLNSGTIMSFSTGISIGPGETVPGRVLNNGVISTTSGSGISIGGDSNIKGGVTNSGTITVKQSGIGIRVSGGATVSGGITNSGAITSATNDGIRVDFNAAVVGDIVNASGGKITANAGRGIAVSSTGAVQSGAGGSGSIINNGAISARTGIFLRTGGTIAGTIQNTGTVTGTTAAVDISGDSAATTVDQNAGAMLGAVKLSASHADLMAVNGGLLDGQVTGGTSTTLKVTGGTLAVRPGFADSIGSFQETGGTLGFHVTPATAGSITAAGNAALGGNFLVVESAGLYAPAHTYFDILKAGSFSGQFASVTSVSPIITPSIVTDAGGRSLVLDANFATIQGLTPNQHAASVGLEALFTGPGSAGITALLSPLFALDRAGYDKAADQLSGELHAQTSKVGLDLPEWAIHFLQDRLGLGGGANGLFAATPGAQLAAADGGGDIAQAASPGAAGPWSVWASGYGGVLDGSDTSDAPGFSTTEGGGLVGADYRFSDSALVGAAFNYAHASLSFNQGAGHSGLDTYMLAPYGRITSGNWYGSGVLALGWQSTDTTRNIAFPGFSSTATSSHGSWIYGAHAEAGYVVPLGGATLTPLVGLGYTRLSGDSFTETGGGAATLRVTRDNAEQLASSLGARVAMRIDLGASGTLVPEAHAIWQHDFLGERQTVGEAFAAAPGTGFSVISSSFGRDSGRLGLGATLELNPATSLFIDYDAQVQGGFTSQIGSIGAKLSF